LPDRWFARFNFGKFIDEDHKADNAILTKLNQQNNKPVVEANAENEDEDVGDDDDHFDRA
jgi:hypothetical protein